MKVLSLFDGISCARVALERAGIPVEAYYASEIDKYAIQVSNKNYGSIVHLGSVTDIGKDKFFNELPEIDLLIGGSPCQDLSIAKKDRKGLDGERSGLFWEYVRILREVQPKYFILENVASMPKEAKEIITRELGVEPIMINASLVSAQNRKRLFWVGSLQKDGSYKKVEISQPEDKGILLKDILEENVSDKYLCSYKAIEGINKSNFRERKPIDVEKSKMGTLKVGGDIKRINTAAILGRKQEDGTWKQTLDIGSSEKANALTLVRKVNMLYEYGKVRHLTPIEYERLQSLPDNYTEGISNTQRYKCLGNAFNVDVVAHILSFIPR